MTKLRWVAIALLVVAVLAAMVPLFGLAGSDEVPVAGKPDVVETPTEVPEPTETTAPEDAVQDGPELGERSKEANEALQRNKVVVAAMAAGLFAIVLWGRRVRKINSNKVKLQSKGKA